MVSFPSTAPPSPPTWSRESQAIARKTLSRVQSPQSKRTTKYTAYLIPQKLKWWWWWWWWSHMAPPPERPPLERIAVYITLFQSSPVSTWDNQPFTKAKSSHYHKVLSFLTCDLKDSEQRVDDGVEVWGRGALGEVQLAAKKLGELCFDHFDCVAID